MSFGVDEKLQRALDIGYAYLNRRERTEHEVRAQLERKGISAELAEDAVRTFIEQGFLNDERFAELFVTDKRELEQWGSERIRRGLLARGIDRELAERALVDRLRASSAKRSPASWSGRWSCCAGGFPTPPRERRDRDRALGMLVRKGYETELAVDALGAYARGD